VPSEPAEEYRVTVSMKAGPFEIDEKVESTIRVPKPPVPKEEEK
jgi:hypothetical protein